MKNIKLKLVLFGMMVCAISFSSCCKNEAKAGVQKKDIDELQLHEWTYGIDSTHRIIRAKNGWVYFHSTSNGSCMTFVPE